MSDDLVSDVQAEHEAGQRDGAHAVGRAMKKLGIRNYPQAEQRLTAIYDILEEHKDDLKMVNRELLGGGNSAFVLVYINPKALTGNRSAIQEVVAGVRKSSMQSLLVEKHGIDPQDAEKMLQQANDPKQFNQTVAKYIPRMVEQYVQNHSGFQTTSDAMQMSLMLDTHMVLTNESTVRGFLTSGHHAENRQKAARFIQSCRQSKLQAPEAMYLIRAHDELLGRNGLTKSEALEIARKYFHKKRNLTVEDAKAFLTLSPVNSS